MNQMLTSSIGTKLKKASLSFPIIKALEFDHVAFDLKLTANLKFETTGYTGLITPLLSPLPENSDLYWPLVHMF